jgi:hypothetical protein
VQWCTDGYFRALELPLIRGQGLPAFGGNDAARVVVVNRRLAFEYFAGEDPVGQHIAFRPLRGGGGAYEGSFEIVGVVEDVRNRGLQERPAPQAYLTGAPGNSNPLFIVRTAADPMLSLNLIKREMAAVDRRAVLVQPTRVEDALDRGLYSQPRFSLIVLGLFGATGTLLVAIGVFSVMAYTVSRLTREIAVRMALGADRRQVSRVVLRLAAVPVTAGVIVGALASFATSRLIANQLWNTSPHDPLTIAVAIGTIVLVAMAACYIPARRAMRIEPMTALRHD